jgi:hypothetical protein
LNNKQDRILKGQSARDVAISVKRTPDNLGNLTCSVTGNLGDIQLKREKTIELEFESKSPWKFFFKYHPIFYSKNLKTDLSTTILICQFLFLFVNNVCGIINCNHVLFMLTISCFQYKMVKLPLDV